MYVRIVTFRLVGRTAEHYRQHCENIAAAFTRWPGLRCKLWLDDPSSDTRGGVYVFDSKTAADASREDPVFAAMCAEPTFADLRIVEYPTLAVPTGVTAGPLAAP